MTSSLAARFARDPYGGYLYAYPHKTAYRALDPAISLEAAWAEERRDRLFLYVHVPFCRTRCAFCNLFSTTELDSSTHDRYLSAVSRQAERVARALGADRRFARLALGGGTPSLLAPERLEKLFAVVEELLGAAIAEVPTSFELSPETTTPEVVSLLKQRGVGRVSVGIQAFDSATLRALGRAQLPSDAALALARLRDAAFPVLNVDLMYGASQTVDAWLATLHEALRFEPEEIYLYPLYVRPLTGLALTAQTWNDHRLECYRAGRALLLDHGYRQLSKRCFRATRSPDAARTPDARPAYSCQDDGMVGLGPGARSYTRSLHYSAEYAVGRAPITEVIDRYLRATPADHSWIRHGIALDMEEQKRRFVIKSLLRAEGLSLEDYCRRFHARAETDFPELAVLASEGLAILTARSLELTERGLELSDAIGPWLISERIRALMQEYTWR